MANTPENSINQALTPPEVPTFAPKLYGIALLTFAVFISGIWLMSKYTVLDTERDLQTWREKLNLIAESRSTDVNQWVGNHFRELRTLADNPSLQLYMTELQMADDKAPVTSAEPAQKSYLRNLLLFTAERAGFAAEKSTSNIPANVTPVSKNALAIITGTKDIMVSTPMSDATRDLILQHVSQSKPGMEGLIDIQKDSDGTPYIGFIVPVYSIQGDRDADSQIGRIVGIKTLDEKLFSLLKHPGTTEKTIESILVREHNHQVDYLSPLHDGTEPLAKSIDLEPSALAEAALVKEVGNFLSQQVDYQNKVVLATSRAIPGTPWTLIVKIDRQEALKVSEQRRAVMVVVFMLLLCIVVLLIIAVWRHAFSRRAVLLSDYFKDLAARAMAQERLLRLVADNQPESIYLMDNQHTVHFANQQAADDAGTPLDLITGRSLGDVRGYARTSHIIEQCEKAMKQDEVFYEVQGIDQGGDKKYIRSAYVPLSHVPVAKLAVPTPGVLLVEQDISEVVRERERRAETQRQLVYMMVKLVDKRDPFAANHSELVAQIAQAVATDMALDTTTVDTTATAGRLMNIGKIVVPTELLTKTDSLTSEEKRTIRDSMTMAADMIKGISFDGPVAETLRQWQEHWDGSGALGLKGEHILISARIIAASNAFIGMISPRSWRTAMPIEAATKFLLDQADSSFDRRVVVALINYVENHSGRAFIKKILDGQKGAA